MSPSLPLLLPPFVPDDPSFHPSFHLHVDFSFHPSFLLPIDPVDIPDPSATTCDDRCLSPCRVLPLPLLLPDPPCPVVAALDLSWPDDPSLDVLPDPGPPGSWGPEASRWDAAARSKHSSACRGRSRLTAQEKLDIVCLYYSAPATTKHRRTIRQRDLSRMYGKSRPAISKVLRPEYARGVMATARGLMVKNRNEVLHNIAEEERLKGELAQTITTLKVMRRGPGRATG
ncbi:hypothetical protein GUITHDRAFT_120070 [Guillardia theta CCMP2712]|uniref:Uncharacterized protein n=1 Tax=Guillardia theta (strain CCMP2712) TaxID=905079 RepID=L1ID27_GUITC|nr:hypothetical protein GUITHDRAFT_120070 [Guillardia theta CCMP2712]EKX33740.1 hypothetical protein GUITHDRAFT_120070 [Guillardia theta CCMP2712]|eukprot:XP_005820720.1 hypothetical protein GUITHDRAFT_120070 [Guillardia theta CCMP2712]